MPSLTTAAGLQRKTAHSLRVTCASTLFQNNVEEKLIRERTGHISNALFRYEKPSEEQIKCVSDCLGPPLLVESTDDGKTSKAEPVAAEEDTFLDDDFDEYLASLNSDELALLDAKCDSKENNYSEPQSRSIFLDGLFCNSDLSNTTVNINVHLSK